MCTDSPNTANLLALLTSLMNTGIEIDKNLRQPAYYSSISFSELKIECFSIITDLLKNQKIPHWLSQRIAWYYSNKFFQEIIADLTISSDNLSDKTSMKIEHELFNREKIVIYLRKTIGNILKEWLSEKSKLTDQNIHSLMLSFYRNENNSSTSLVYDEFGLKNKRRVMEDKTAVFENIDLFDKSILSNSIIQNNELEFEVRKKRSNALFGVFDGHCGIDCAQYVSSHLPMSIIQQPDLKNRLEHDLSIEDIFLNCFQSVNNNFTKKSEIESMRSGSTACIAILSSSSELKDRYTKLNIAWCGDTQFCLVKNGRISYLTESHKPNDIKEKLRIEQSGGCVSYTANTWRVNGSLGVARAFGDVEYQSSGVCAEPDLASFDLDGSEDYFLIGCDGLWDSIDLDLLCEFIYDLSRNSADSDKIAEMLVKKAKDNGSLDNITAVFVLLKDNFDQISKPN